MTDLQNILALAQPLSRDADIAPRDVIGGLFPRGYFSLLASPPGTGKTWIMQYLSCRLSIGGNILGGLRTRQTPCKCLIFAGETGRDLLLRRLKLTVWDCNPDLLRVYDAIELQRNNVNIMLNEDAGRATFLAILAAECPDIVFIDTLISFHSADESKQAEMSAVYRFLLKAAHACDCAIVCNHHTRKRNNKNPTAALGQDDVIGTSAGVRLAASVFIAEQEADTFGEDEYPAVWVKNVKSWDAKLPPFSVKFYRDQWSNRLDYAVSWGDTAAAEERSAKARMRRLIADTPENAVLTVEQVAASLATSADNARKLLERAASHHDVERITLPDGAGAKAGWRVLRNSRSAAQGIS